MRAIYTVRYVNFLSVRTQEFLKSYLLTVHRSLLTLCLISEINEFESANYEYKRGQYQEI